MILNLPHWVLLCRILFSLADILHSKTSLHERSCKLIIVSCKLSIWAPLPKCFSLIAVVPSEHSPTQNLNSKTLCWQCNPS